MSQSFGQQKRLAVVIGNSNYKHSSKLKNPKNDAQLMTRVLTDLKFDVITVLDGKKSDMDSQFRNFVRKSKDYDVVLFYYAGHGVEIEGSSFLVPVDAKATDELTLRDEGFPVKKLSDNLFFKYQKKLVIIILDACRTKPINTSRGFDQSIAKIEANSEGVFIAYATGEGATASDGLGDNGLYTKYVAEEILKDQNIHQAFQNVRKKVSLKSNGRQTPMEQTTMIGDFHFTRYDPLNSMKFIGYDTLTTKWLAVPEKTGLKIYGSIGFTNYSVPFGNSEKYIRKIKLDDWQNALLRYISGNLLSVTFRKYSESQLWPSAQIKVNLFYDREEQLQDRQIFGGGLTEFSIPIALNYSFKPYDSYTNFFTGLGLGYSYVSTEEVYERMFIPGNISNYNSLHPEISKHQVTANFYGGVDIGALSITSEIQLSKYSSFYLIGLHYCLSNFVITQFTRKKLIPIYD